MDIDQIEALIRDVPDFPEPGIVFKDITPVLANPIAFSTITDLIVVHFGRGNVDKVVGIEARGFILASPVAYHFGAGFVPIRKQGKLPSGTVGEEYELEYGTATIELHTDGIEAGRTGADRGRRARHRRDRRGRGLAGRAAGGNVCGIACLIELDFLNGRDQLRRPRVVHADPLLSRAAPPLHRRAAPPSPHPYTGSTGGMRVDSKEETALEQAAAPSPQPRRARASAQHPAPAPAPGRRGTCEPHRPRPEEGPGLQPQGRPEGDPAGVRLRRVLARGAEAASSGEDFITHPVAVTDILADLRLDTTTLEAALLHDTVEDTHVTVQTIEDDFGVEVARIVDGLTKLDRFEFRTREQEQAENVRKMIVAMAGDIRVLLIKLADRLHNMRTLGVFSEAKQRRIATETMEIYAPLAHRLGVQELKWELEDLSFKALHPGPYREIASLVDARRGERTALIEQVTTEARSKLKEQGVKAEVEGRPKHLYSIYEKMVIRGKEFNEIYDLVGVRILVDSIRDCYAALGAVHALWKPIPGRFKDYVAMPKSNMYQSLHTTVVGPAGKPLEIQIRTREMHRTAKFGIAAHWRYKEGSKSARDAAEAAWLGQMMDWLKDMADPREFMDSLKIDLYGGQVFVFTPKGDVVNLPAGATPVDFAYAIHTDVGHRTIGAKVGGKLVPLDYELQTGDAVDVLTSKAQGEGPSQDWLQFVKTPRARSKIRQWFSRGRREDAMEQGRDAVARLMRKERMPLKRLATEGSLHQVAEDLKYPNLDALYVAVGEGHVSPQSVVARLGRLLSGVRTRTRSRCRSHDRCASGPPTRPAASWCADWPTCGFAWVDAAPPCPATRSWGSSRRVKG